MILGATTTSDLQCAHSQVCHRARMDDACGGRNADSRISSQVALLAALQFPTQTELLTGEDRHTYPPQPAGREYRGAHRSRFSTAASRYGSMRRLGAVHRIE